MCDHILELLLDRRSEERGMRLEHVLDGALVYASPLFEGRVPPVLPRVVCSSMSSARLWRGTCTGCPLILYPNMFAIV
jgi:hypothetical protein